MNQNTLDFYANLLIQCDEPVEGSSEDLLISDLELQKGGGGGVLGQTEDVIREVWMEFRTIESQARLALEWLNRQKPTECRMIESQSDSIMQAILAADGAFDRAKCYNWYSQMQWFSDCLLLGRGDLCASIFDKVTLEDLLLIEHVSIVSFEASLQALKMWNLDPVCEKWHAAGDVIVLTILALKKIPDQRVITENLIISDEVSESARARLYGFLIKLFEKDSIMKTKILEETRKLRKAELLNQPLMESSEDQLLGIPLLIQLFGFRDDPLFEFMLPLLSASATPLIIQNEKISSVELSSRMNAALKCVENSSWLRRVESFQSAEQSILSSLEKNSYFDLQDLSELINSLATWLVKELETDASWVNQPRGKCRRLACELCSKIIQLIPSQAFILESKLCTRLITLLARTWVVSNTQSSTAAGGSLSPSQGRYKNVDEDYEAGAAESALILLTALRNVCESRSKQGVKNHQPADLLDDILNQIVSGLLRASTFGLPIFLETPFEDLSRRALSERRKTAQIYFATNSGIIRAEDLAPYSEVYRNFNENIVNYAGIVRAALNALIGLSSDSDESLYSKLLSYVTSNVGQGLVFEALVRAMLEDIRTARVNIFSEILEEGSSTSSFRYLWSFDRKIGKNLWLKGISRCRRILSAVEIGLDTNSDYRPQVSVTEDLAEYMKSMKRLKLDTTELLLESEGKTQILELMSTSVRLLGNSWLARSIQDYQVSEQGQRSIRASCVMCLACDWVEESLEGGGEDFEDLATSSIVAADDDAASESSLKDFLDVHFHDDYSSQVEIGNISSLMTCQLRPELYHYVKNTFWDDRMAGR